jgi:hypothetical protein
MMHWRRFAARTNKSGDRGSPCLTPLWELIFFPGTPFSKTGVVGELKIHFLSRALCHLGLLHSFSDNFVCCLPLLDQVHFFDAIICHHIILFHYFPFAVVHHIISSA